MPMMQDKLLARESKEATIANLKVTSREVDTFDLIA